MRGWGVGVCLTQQLLGNGRTKYNIRKQELRLLVSQKKQFLELHCMHLPSEVFQGNFVLSIPRRFCLAFHWRLGFVADTPA